MYRSIFCRKEDTGPSIKRIIQVLKDNNKIRDLEAHWEAECMMKRYHDDDERNRKIYRGTNPTKYSERPRYEESIQAVVSGLTEAIESWVDEIEAAEAVSVVYADRLSVISDK
jgi:hypothetical protein